MSIAAKTVEFKGTDPGCWCGKRGARLMTRGLGTIRKYKVLATIFFRVWRLNSPETNAMVARGRDAAKLVLCINFFLRYRLAG